MIIPKRSYCNSCGEQIQGEHWKTKCDDCFKSDHAVTTPFKESKHPAIRYEANNPVVEPTPATPEHVAKCLAELTKLVTYTPEAMDEVEEVDRMTCEHTFVEGHIAALCSLCGIFKHQYFYSIQVEPRATREFRQ